MAPKMPPKLPSRPKIQAPPPPNTSTARTVQFGTINLAPSFGHRVVIYGPGGIGKTTVAACAPGPVAFLDLDESLQVLGQQLDGLDVRIVSGITTWDDIRDVLHGTGWDDIKTIVIDTVTKAEELALAWTLENVPHEKGGKVNRIEDYGYGKGYTHVYETFLSLLSDLDAHVRAGRNVVLLCHDCTATVPNPMGEDYIRYEPRLQSPASGKATTRLRVREWADHVLFMGYDLDVKKGKNDKTGKAHGGDTRTIYPQEQPHCMAKSRTLVDPMEIQWRSTVLWDTMFGTAEEETE